MQFPAPVSIKWIAELIGAELIGDNNGTATGINEIHKVEPGDLVCISLESAADFKMRCPEQYHAFVECAAFVNWRRIEIGEPPILVLSFNA